MAKKFSGSNGPVTVGTALTTILTLEANALADDTMVDITNTGGTAFSDLQILIRGNSAGAYHSVIAAADWAAILAGGSIPDIVRRMGLVNPATLAGAGVAWFTLNPSGIESIEIQAAVASGTTIATATFGGRTSR